MFAAQAHSLEASNLLDSNPPQRYTLLLCFLYHVQTRLRDDLATMLVKRMNKVRTNAKKNLDDIKQEQIDMREGFIDMFAHVVHMTQQTPDDTKLGQNVRQLVENAGGADSLWEDYEAMMAYHQNNYLPLTWRNYSSYRRALFDVVDTLDILARIQHWFPFSQYFGPASGSQTKRPDADARYLLTLFGYGCNLGPKQTAQHSRLAVTRRILQRINSQHISIEQLDKAIRDTINQDARFDLPRFWGTGKVAAADGPQFDQADAYSSVMRAKSSTAIPLSRKSASNTTTLFLISLCFTISSTCHTFFSN